MEVQKQHKNKRKILMLSAFVSLLVVAVVPVTVAAHFTTNHGGDEAAAATAQVVMKSTCAATLYPELCMSTINTTAATSAAVKSSKDVLITALDYTIHTVERNFFTVKKFSSSSTKSLTPRQKGALGDCLEVIGDTLEELGDVKAELKGFGFKNYSLAAHKESLLTLLSAAQTNKESCLDGFSHYKADKKIREALIAGQMHVFRLVSNVMAIINDLTGTEIASNDSLSKGRRLDENQGEWPEWLSAGDRRLLQASTVKADVTVAADGSGNHRTVAAAVAAAPEVCDKDKGGSLQRECGDTEEEDELDVRRRWTDDHHYHRQPERRRRQHYLQFRHRWVLIFKSSAPQSCSIFCSLLGWAPRGQ